MRAAKAAHAHPVRGLHTPQLSLHSFLAARVYVFANNLFLQFQEEQNLVSPNNSILLLGKIFSTNLLLGVIIKTA